MYQRDRLNSRARAFLVTEAARIGISGAARNSGVSRRTVYRWRRRAPDFTDHPCRPRHSPQRSPDALEGSVLALRMAERIAAAVGAQGEDAQRAAVELGEVSIDLSHK